MGRCRIKINIQVPKIYFQVRCSLSAIYQHGCPGIMRPPDHLFNRIYGPQRIGDMIKEHQSGFIAQ